MKRRLPTSAPPTPEMKLRFGQNLARCRGAAGISQEELSFRASLHRTEVSFLERGERMPRVDTAMRLAGSLGVPLNELIAGLEWRSGYEIVVPGSWEAIEWDAQAAEDQTPSDDFLRSRPRTAPDDRWLALQGPVPLQGFGLLRRQPLPRSRAGRPRPARGCQARRFPDRGRRIHPQPRCPDPPRGCLLDLGARPCQRPRLATRLCQAFRASRIHRFGRRTPGRGLTPRFGAAMLVVAALSACSSCGLAPAYKSHAVESGAPKGTTLIWFSPTLT